MSQSIDSGTGSHRLWDLYVELRKELVESQKIRAQILGVKIAFTSAALGFLLKESATLDRRVFVIPALAAVCFDFVICSYSFSIKRIGAYLRDHLEPALVTHQVMPGDVRLWQDFLRDRKTSQQIANYGNLGLTAIAVIMAAVAVSTPPRPRWYLAWIGLIIAAIIADIAVVREARRLGKNWNPQEKPVV
jgi:hypothetical protein